MAAANSRKLAAALLIAIFVNGTLSGAQLRAPAQPLEPISSESATMTLLQQMTHEAGVIFVGEVISIQHPAGYAGSGQDAAEGIVTIEFRVDNRVRGCFGASVYTLREWAGLWTGGERYRVGQRLLMFLHKPNASGLSSPVHGGEGAIPLRGGGVAPGPYDGSALAGDWLVDLRWVQAQAPRAIAPSQGTIPSVAPLRVAAGAKVDPSNLDRVNEAFARFEPRNSPVEELVPVSDPYMHWIPLPPDRERSMLPLAQVLSLCRAWLRSSDASQ